MAWFALIDGTILSDGFELALADGIVLSDGRVVTNGITLIVLTEGFALTDRQYDTC